MSKTKEVSVLVRIFSGIVDSVDVYANKKDAEKAHEAILDGILTDCDEITEESSYADKVSLYREYAHDLLEEEVLLFVEKVK